MANRQFSGVIAGYDPGGNNGHGLAIAKIQNGQCAHLEVMTLSNAEAVISKLEEAGPLHAVGIDTLAAWATGPSGWRAADLWLRRQYMKVRPSIVSPNGLYGSMCLNGMAVLKSIRESMPGIHVTETHPKVLYWALAGMKHNYLEMPKEMDDFLTERLGHLVSTANEHEWDAVISVVAALRGIDGSWTNDLFLKPLDETGRLTFPAGQANYWWPPH